VVGFAGLVVLLGLLERVVGLSDRDWLTGVTAGLAVGVLLAVALARRPGAVLGPAGWVTLLRAQLVCAVAALVVDGAHGERVRLIVVLAVVALVLDGVDGRVARRTGTASALGARFDMEVDALLILVLSGYVAPGAGWWVLVIGAARYLLVAAGRVLPWLHGTLPPRPWCKVVAVVQGVVLTVAAAHVLPLPVTRGALAVALALLVESFGREVRDLWRLSRRSEVRAPVLQLVRHG
jgi:phosphatidylglycerophosphate synthase